MQWSKHYIVPFNITKDTDLHWFQYRIQHRFLPINQNLKRIGISDNDKCYICNIHEESLVHLFCQ